MDRPIFRWAAIEVTDSPRAGGRGAMRALIRGPAVIRTWLDRQASDADEARAQAEALRENASERRLEPRRTLLGFRVRSLVVLASVPFRNNPVMGGVLFTGVAGEMPAGWASGQSRPSRLRSSWRRYPGS